MAGIGTASVAFGADHVSTHLYRPSAGTAVRAVEATLEHARAAAAVGFDGVTISEHHGGFETYFPSPVQVALWVLDETAIGWAGAVPMLTPLRPIQLQLEEVAWVAARHPGRLGVGFAGGYDTRDFEFLGLDHEKRKELFRETLDVWTAYLRGDGPVTGDPAIDECLTGLPGLMCSGGLRAARGAARRGLGMLLPPDSDEAVRSVFDEYTASGGTGARIFMQWAWLGAEAPFDADAIQAQYTGGTPGQRVFAPPPVVRSDSAEEIAETLVDQMRRLGATCMNLRFHSPGLPAEAFLDQLELFGSECLPLIRERLALVPAS